MMAVLEKPEICVRELTDDGNCWKCDHCRSLWCRKGLLAFFFGDNWSPLSCLEKHNDNN